MLLGRAAYTWAYTEWDLIYMLHWATGRDLGRTATGGQLVDEFREMLAKDRGTNPDSFDLAREAAAELERLNHRRNDILHAHPATVAGNQRLDRYAPSHPHATPGAVERSDLVDFVREVEAARSLTDKLFEELSAAST